MTRQYDKRLFWREGAEGGCMSGVLYFRNEKPVIGTGVLVVVDEVNKPTGIWNGVLEAVGVDQGTSIGFSSDVRWAVCNVRLNDPLVPKEYSAEPYVNYAVYVGSTAIDYLRKRLTDANTEIRGLKRRMEIERGVWHAALKVIVSPDALGQFNRILDEFLERLGR